MKKTIFSLLVIASITISFFIWFKIKQNNHSKIGTEEKIYEGVQITQGVYRFGIGSIENIPFQRKYALIWIYKQGSNDTVRGTKVFEGENIGDSGYKIGYIGRDFKGKFLTISN